MNGNSKFFYDFYWSFTDNFFPVFLEFPNEAIVPLDYSNPITSLFFQKCGIISASFFKIDKSLIINIVHNLLGNQRKSLVHFFHIQSFFSNWWAYRFQIPSLNERSLVVFYISTDKSFSEALILASTNPQYDKRLFIELQAQNIGRTCCVHKLLWISKLKQKQFVYTTCSPHVLSLEFSCIELVNSMNNPLSYLWVSWCKNKTFWQRFTCTNLSTNHNLVEWKKLLTLVKRSYYGSNFVKMLSFDHMTERN